MHLALSEAKAAAEASEVPIGAAIAANGQLIAKGRNQCETLHDSSAHAELIALTAATNHLQNKYLNECTLYVTLEPCAMCAGAMYWAQLARLVYGASDPTRGFSRYHPSPLHPRTKVTAGLHALECELLLRIFFKRLRNN